MAGEMEKPFKEGYLWLPPQGVMGQIKKSWQKKYCQLYRASKQGIQRLEIYENEEEVLKTYCGSIITLENCIKITQDAQKSQSNVFRVVTKTNVHVFAAASEEELLAWVSAFQSVAFQDSVASLTIEEDNDLYCSSGDVDIFSVRLISSEASDKNGLTPGDYTLVVAPTELQLRKAKASESQLVWPYRYIRRYGYSTGKFTFEAGRKCKSGEGVFAMEHNNQQEIFRSISAKMKSIKKMLAAAGGGEGLGEEQLQHALGMSAGSRSPLPPETGSGPPPPPRPARPRPPPLSAPTPPSRPQPQPPTPNVFLTQPPAPNNYDRLQHFGSTNKLNLTPGYSTPITLPRAPAEPPTAAARTADDSHRGYGMIRKRSDDSTHHSAPLANTIEYAIVLKPHVV